MAVVNALDPTQNPETLNTLQTNLNNLVADTEVPSSHPCWRPGVTSMTRPPADAGGRQEEDREDKTKFKKFVKRIWTPRSPSRSSTNTSTPPTPSKRCSYEARNGASWRANGRHPLRHPPPGNAVPDHQVRNPDLAAGLFDDPDLMFDDPRSGYDGLDLAPDGYIWQSFIGETSNITIDRGIDARQGIVGEPLAGVMVAHSTTHALTL